MDLISMQRDPKIVEALSVLDLQDLLKKFGKEFRLDEGEGVLRERVRRMLEESGQGSPRSLDSREEDQVEYLGPLDEEKEKGSGVEYLGPLDKDPGVEYLGPLEGMPEPMKPAEDPRALHVPDYPGLTEGLKAAYQRGLKTSAAAVSTEPGRRGSYPEGLEAFEPGFTPPGEGVSEFDRVPEHSTMADWARAGHLERQKRVNRDRLVRESTQRRIGDAVQAAAQQGVTPGSPQHLRMVEGAVEGADYGPEILQKTVEWYRSQPDKKAALAQLMGVENPLEVANPENILVDSLIGSFRGGAQGLAQGGPLGAAVGAIKGATLDTLAGLAASAGMDLAGMMAPGNPFAKVVGGLGGAGFQAAVRDAVRRAGIEGVRDLFRRLGREAPDGPRAGRSGPAQGPGGTFEPPDGPVTDMAANLSGGEAKGPRTNLGRTLADLTKTQHQATEGVRLHNAYSSYLQTGDVNRFLEEIPTTEGLRPREVRRADPEGMGTIAEVEMAKGTKPAIRTSGGYATRDFQERMAELPDLQKGVTANSLDTQRLHEVAGGGRVKDNPVVDHLLRPAQDGLLASQFYYNTRAAELGEIIERNGLDKGPLYRNKVDRRLAGRVADVLGPDLLHSEPRAVLANNERIRELLKGVNPEKQERLIRGVQEIRLWMDETRAQANTVRGKQGRELIGYQDRYLPRIRKRSLKERALGVSPEEPSLSGKEGKGGLDQPGFIHPNQPSNPRAKERTHPGGYEQEFDIVLAAQDHLENMSRDMFRAPLVDHYKAHVEVMRKQGKERMARSFEKFSDEVLAGKTPPLTAWLNEAGPLVQFGRAQTRRISRGVNRAAFPLNFSFILFRQPSSMALTVGRYGVKPSLRAFGLMFNPTVKRLADDSYHFQMKKGSGANLAINEDLSRTRGTQIPRALDDRTMVGRLADFTVAAMEDFLSRHAHAAALLDGSERLGLKGRELTDYASAAMGKTQSMYNPEDVPGLLRNKDLTSWIKFQTFYFELMNNARELGWRMPVNEGLKGQRLKSVARFIAAATVFNQLSQWGRGDDSYDWSKPHAYAPFVGTLFGSGARVPGQGFKPMPYQYAEDFWQGVKQTMEEGKLDKLRRWGLRYHVKGGTQLSRTWDGVVASIEGKVEDKRGRRLFKVEGPTEKARAVTVGPWSTRASMEYWEKRNQKKEGPSYLKIKNIEKKLIQGGRATLEELGYVSKGVLQDILRSRGETKGLWKNKSELQQRIMALEEAQGRAGVEE